MNFHNEMMNIPIDYSDWKATKETNTYAMGHRDARHAAAEIAIKADERIEALERALRGLLDNVSFDYESPLDPRPFINKAKEILDKPENSV